MRSTSNYYQSDISFLKLAVEIIKEVLEIAFVQETSTLIIVGLQGQNFTTM